jgi:hypothetical protein
MSLRTTSRRRTVARLGVLGLVALTSLGQAAPAASAAPAAPEPALTLPLDPAAVELSLLARENLGDFPFRSPVTAGTGVSLVEMNYGGSARLRLPAQVDGSAMVATLELAPAADALPTRTYSTDAAAPADQIVMTDLGDGWYDVVMPADDGTNGPFARLVFTGISPSAAAGPDVTFVDPLTYRYRFMGSMPGFLQYAVPQLVATAQVPCHGSSDSCLAGSVAAGSAVSLPVPPASRLRALGLGDPQAPFSAVSVYGLDANGNPSEQRALTEDSLDADGRVVTIPQDTPAGRYRIFVSMGVPMPISGVQSEYPTELSVTSLDIQVTPALNAGLRSNTGWVEPVTDTGVSPLVFLGAGMVVVAGLTTAVVLRPRRRAAGK